MTHADDPRPEPLGASSGYGFPVERERLLPWSYAEERLAQARIYWLATTYPDGRPHVAPLWGVWVDHLLYFDGLPTARWARNAARNPSATVHLESGLEVVIVDGTLEDLTTSEDVGARIVAAWDRKYGRLHPNPATDGIFLLRPRMARGWSSETLEDGTRWRFDVVGKDPTPSDPRSPKVT